MIWCVYPNLYTIIYNLQRHGSYQFMSWWKRLQESQTITVYAPPQTPHWWRCHPAQPAAKTMEQRNPNWISRMGSYGWPIWCLIMTCFDNWWISLKISQCVQVRILAQLWFHLSVNQNKRLKNWQNTSQCHYNSSLTTIKQTCPPTPALRSLIEVSTWLGQGL